MSHKNVHKCHGVVVVTGGSRGIGASTCKVLARDGFAVVINYVHSKNAAEIVAKEIIDDVPVECVQADVSNENDVRKMFRRVEEFCSEQGLPFYGLVNNAGILGPRRGLIEEGETDGTSLEREFLKVLRTNCVGPLLCTREAAVLMKKSGNHGGCIVNISSGSSNIGKPLLYAASKGALNSLQAGLISELCSLGIRINTISPGLTATDMIAGLDTASFGDSIPMGRVGSPAEIAEGVSFLMSPKASYVAGANIRISGGKAPGTFIG